MKFAIQDKLTGLSDYKEVFQMAKEVGYDGVELNLFQQPLQERLAAELQAAIDGTGIPLTAICGGYRHWIGHFDETKRLEAVADVQLSLKLAAQLGAQGIIAPAAYGMFSKSLPHQVLPRDVQGDHNALVDSLKRIAEHADKLQVTLFIEPLNRYEDHMLHTVSQAASLIREIESRHLKVLGDFFHMNIEEADISRTIESEFSNLGYFHLADSNRQLPGKAHTDFRTPFQTLQRLNYQGYLSMECRIGDEKKELLQETLHFLRSCLQG
ncbi:sugar phosphate isomerase/epimerase family protein [Paenibacillus qinlingensis]|uniref:Sugar phosphate isomerase/epimerase n=1 Tax=Paenibacillus qinlingensis TaxID=1837343 RepID=A0ABU1NQ53_9BACL|nr:sugar phosphate isomerase/epimerase family protein [Paenibacillus qinlingensis]MDR6549007.1 sugar phosphate isomerase/epimerase [Paenibacillus qinlingensis]